MTRWSIGENKLNAADRLQKFLDGIESYITAKNVVPSKLRPTRSCFLKYGKLIKLPDVPFGP